MGLWKRIKYSRWQKWRYGRGYSLVDGSRGNGRRYSPENDSYRVMEDDESSRVQ